jgi:hypothetical protein
VGLETDPVSILLRWRFCGWTSFYFIVGLDLDGYGTDPVGWTEMGTGLMLWVGLRRVRDSFIPER